MLRPNRVFDGEAMHEGWRVRIEGGRIAAAGAAIDETGAEAINLPGRMPEKTGAVKPGMIADLAALEGDPSAGISARRRPRLVMQAGEVRRAP